MTHQHRKTPATGQRGGSSREVTHRFSSSRSHTTSLTHPGIDQQAVFDQLNGAYIVVAEIKSPAGEHRTRRRFYASLESAQRAVDRARDTGRDARLFLGQITIIGGGTHD